MKPLTATHAAGGAVGPFWSPGVHWIGGVKFSAQDAAGSLPKAGRLLVHKLVPWYIARFLVLAKARSLDLVPHPALGPMAFAANVLTVISKAALVSSRHRYSGGGTGRRFRYCHRRIVAARVGCRLLRSDPIAPHRLRTIDTASHKA
jgi:hypothetical protein